MKYLTAILLFLLTINSFADVLVEIENTVTGKSYKGKFETQPEADLWKSDNIANNSWGKPDRWELKEDTCPGVERTVGEAPDEYQECFHPIEYTITETDITAIEQAKKDKKDADDLTIQQIRQDLIDGTKLSSDQVEAYIKIQLGL